MCGRFGQTGDPDYYGSLLQADAMVEEPLSPSWNVAPTDRIYAVRHRKGNTRLEILRWGLIPHWAPDLRTFHINARSETLVEKALFRDGLARRRCLIPADGFYEWTARSQGHVPYWFHRQDSHPLALAGIWSVRRHPKRPEEWLVSCAIITGQALGPVAAVHNRMPVALPGDRWGPWLDPHLDDPFAAHDLLMDPDLHNWTSHPVSRRVNRVANNDPTLVEPVTYPSAPTLDM